MNIQVEPDAYRKFPFNGTYAEYSFPELLLRVNFSGLTGQRDPPPGSGLAITRESLKVYVGLTNSTRDVLETTRPTLLFPGMNLMGVVDLVIRKRFRAPQLSVFGLFDVSLWNCSYRGDVAQHTAWLFALFTTGV
jgi:hypothetical protein